MTGVDPSAHGAVDLVDLGAEHLDAVSAIEATASPHPWSRDLFAGELDLSDDVRTWVVAVESGAGAVVGFGGMMFVASEGHVMNLAVREDRRRRGIAEVMLRELAARAVARGIDALTLEVRESNVAAITLYRRFGFTESGVRPGYYGDGEDALILWSTDPAAWRGPAAEPAPIEEAPAS